MLRATGDHVLLESQVGAYVAEQLAGSVIDEGRARIGALLGVPAGGVVFTESASASLGALLTAWPLAVGASVAVVPSEWGPALEAFTARGLAIRELATDDAGRLDLDQLEHMLLTSPPSAVHLTQVASHRALVQPVAEAALLCRAHEVALWVDAAQALGHVDTAVGADAIYSTSRKWLAGPRGVGVLGISERWWDGLRVPLPGMFPAALPVPRRLESGEAHVAGRVGLSVAVSEHVDLGPPAVWERLRDVGRQTRSALADLPGWQVVDRHDTPCAITALRSTLGADIVTTRARLIADHRIVTTAAGTARAPREMTVAVLRISPHIDCTDDDLDRLRRALSDR